MPIEERVFIAGAGPVGLTAAANLVRHGVPVTVFEAGADLSEELRASTFHPPTLDMLDELGAAKPLIAQGLVAPQFQYRTRDGVFAKFDFAAIADVTRPSRSACSASSRSSRACCTSNCATIRDYRIEFGCRVADVEQDGDGGPRHARARWRDRDAAPRAG